MSGAASDASVDEPANRSLPSEKGQIGLRREVSLPMLVLYGLGTTVGAGIYALTGEVMVENMLNRDTEEGIAAFLEKRKPDWK